jgi:hypothetical protein
VTFPLFTRREFVESNVKRALQVLAAAMILLLVCLPSFSQNSQGTIQGGVFDQSGGAIAGATVTVTDVARGLARNLTTDSAGAYVAQNMNPGLYTVRAEAKGFQTLEHSNIQVEVSQNVRVDLTLQPGAQTQTITVTSEAPAIDTTDSTLGGTVSNASMLALPLNGRNFQRLIDLHPGVVIATVGAGTGNGDYTNGRKQGDDLYRVEGISTIAQTAGLSGVLNGAYRAGDSSSLVPIDAIQEFSTEQSPKADSGWKEGSVVSVGIKSGTNSLHGTAYAFGRDAGATDAANAFSRTITPGTLEQFGATAGGRIIKDNLFVFGGYEGLRDTLGDSNTDTIPYDVATPGTANPAASIVDACNSIETKGGTATANPALISPLSALLAGLNTATCTVSPASSAFENVFPFIGSVPTTVGSNGLPVENFNPPLTSTGPLNNGIIKGDYVPGPHNHFSGMYFVAKATQSINTFGGQLEQQWLNGVVDDVQMYMGSWTWTPNSTWVNDVRFGKAYFNNSTIVGDANLSAAGAWPAGYGMNTGVTNPLFGGIPQITFTAFTGYLGVGTDGLSTRGPEGNYNLVDNVSFLHGKHSFKFGFEYSDILFDQKNAGNILDNQSGLIKFAGLGSASAAGVLTGGFLTGASTGGNLLIGDNTTNYGSHWFAGFFQDDWRVATRVTLNLGLRYEYMGSPFERNNYMGNFNPNVTAATTSAIQQVGPGEPIPSLYNSKYNAFPNNLSPRVGVAWDVRGNGKTVVRAGVSILSDFTGLQTLIKSTPFGANIIGCTVTTSPCPAADFSVIANTAPGGVPTPQNAHTAVFNTYSAAQITAGWASNSVAAPIFPGTTTVTIGGVPTPFTGVTCTPAVPCSAGTVVDPNFRQPHAAEYNLDIERAITSNLAVDVAYVGNYGFDESFSTDLDQALPGIGWNTPWTAAQLAAAKIPAGQIALDTGLTSTQICVGQGATAFGVTCTPNAAGEVGLYTTTFPYLNQISQAQAGVISNYNALQVTATLRATHGLSFLAGYTWAHALDDGTIVYSNQLSQNYGNGTADIRNRFTISSTYEVPGIKSPGQMLEGWSASGLVLLQGGLPWTATDSSSGAANDILGSAGATGVPSYDPWNYSGPPSAFTASQTAIPCYDGVNGAMSGCTSFAKTPASIQAACANAAVAPYAPGSTNASLATAALANFGCYVQNGGIMTPPAYGTYGDSSNGEFRGPHFYNVDLSVSKIWKFRERYSAQFRAEFFNLFNTADFVQTPTSTIPGANQFGCSCTTPDNPARNPNPITGSGGPRHIQFGLKLTF